MLGAEVGEGVIIERHAAGQPLKGQFARLGIAAAVQFAGTTDAAEGGVQPQGAQDARIGGSGAGAMRDGPDFLQQSCEIELFDIGPDGAGLVFVGEQVVEGTQAEFDLIPVGVAQAWRPIEFRLGLGRRFRGVVRLGRGIEFGKQSVFGVHGRAPGPRGEKFPLAFINRPAPPETVQAYVMYKCMCRNEFFTGSQRSCPSSLVAPRCFGVIVGMAAGRGCTPAARERLE